jgi:hypothetical protein
MLAALALSVNPCAGQGITAAPPAPPPVAPAMPATHAIPAIPAAPAAPIAPVAPVAPQISPATHVPAPPPLAAYDDLLKNLPALPDLDSFPPQIATWVRLRGAGLARFGEIPDAADMPAYVRKAGGKLFTNLDTAAIEEMIYMLMMQAAKAASEDLKSMMKEMQEANAAKARARRHMDDLKTAAAESAAKGVAPCLIADCGAATRELAQAAGRGGANPGYQLPVSPTQADVGALTELLKKEVDALSERGELESLKLQTAMNRFSKIMSTLTNLLKKRSTTADSIIGNVK